MTKIEDIFQKIHKELDEYDLEQPDEPATNIKGLITMLQVEVYRLLQS